MILRGTCLYTVTPVGREGTQGRGRKNGTLKTILSRATRACFATPIISPVIHVVVVQGGAISNSCAWACELDVK